MDGDAKGPLDDLLDLVLYAPVGFAVAARELVPELAEKGRRQLDTRLTTARLVGELALAQGRKLGARFWAGATDPAGQPPVTPADGPPGPDVARPRRRLDLAPASAVLEDDGNDLLIGSRPAVAELPIPGYDSLSASQVVQRLPGLTADELEAVRAYEQSGRARRTVLTRVAQLRTAS